MESRLDNMNEEPKVKKKVYNVLVECLQNLYHHIDHDGSQEHKMSTETASSAIFMIGRTENGYSIMTGNYINTRKVADLEDKLERINSLDQDELKTLYKEVLNNEEMSMKGGGGLGMIDIARKSGQKLYYDFAPVNNNFSFFSLNIKISH